MKRLLVIAAATALASGSGLAATALAAPPSPANPAGHSSDIRGVVHANHSAGKRGGSGGNLSYHGGAVMHTNKTYAIYWDPSGRVMSPAYASTIDGFFQNVAAESTHTTNVYYSDTQYYDGSGNITYSSSFGGSVVDTNAYPASGCTDTVAATDVCLSDAQLQTEIANVASAQGWSAGPTTMFFLFTAKGVGSCFDSSHCAFSYYCAYHGDFTTGTAANQHYIYANQPYTNTAPSSCGTGQGPNDPDADSTINVTSHEHNEAITDPYGDAWFDRTGAENGDKCAWTFGTSTGTTGHKYNQTINGAHYYLQQEWSNAHSRCVLQGT